MRCRVCGGRGSHVVGCPGAGGANSRDRVQKIAQAPVAEPVESRPRDEPYAPRLTQKVLGFRAEHAEPVVLAYDDGQSPEHIAALRSIAGEFYLPVVEHGELAAAAAPLGAPVPRELHPSEPAFYSSRLTPS